LSIRISEIEFEMSYFAQKIGDNNLWKIAKITLTKIQQKI